MVEIVAFKPEHLLALKLQAEQASAAPMLTLEYGQQVAALNGIACTGLVDGQVIGCSGLIELWKDRAMAWAFLGEQWRDHFREIHRAVRDQLQRAPWRRIEMAVDVRYQAAKRWAFHLGFQFEGIARAYSPDGRDHEIWARVS